MSDELKRFYREIWAWVQDGCPDHKVFCKNDAVCRNLSVWSGSRSWLTGEDRRLLLNVVYDTAFPFNSDGLWGFAHERRDGTMYQNPKRLAFIEEHAK